MTQAQQSEAQRLAAICDTKGMFPVADELNRMHARILELEQGKCLHQIAEPAAIHPDDAAVDALAAAMKAKLATQRVKGYGGWDTDCTQERLSVLLRKHVDKGDPVDVANFCAFLLARGEGIAAAPQAVQPAVPFMHGIADGCGNAYFEEGCVAPEARDLQHEVDGLNSCLDDDERPYSVVPLYTQPAAQGLDAPNEWEGIHKMPTCDDLIWLYCQDTNTIDGPIAPDPSLEQYGWTHWAYANAPSTAGIDAAQAKQGGAA